jgi:hypothetical protein
MEIQLHQSAQNSCSGIKPQDAVNRGEDGILIFMLLCRLDMCGEVPDGDLHSAGDGQAGGGAGAAHQGSVPDPPDQRVFCPPGSGSTNQRYGSGSGSGSGSFYPSIIMQK